MGRWRPFRRAWRLAAAWHPKVDVRQVSGSGRQPEQPVRIGPGDLAEDLRRGRSRYQLECFLPHAFAANPRRHALGILCRAAALAVLAVAVAAEMQLVLVALEEVDGESRIA